MSSTAARRRTTPRKRQGESNDRYVDSPSSRSSDSSSAATFASPSSGSDNGDDDISLEAVETEEECMDSFAMPAPESDDESQDDDMLMTQASANTPKPRKKKKPVTERKSPAATDTASNDKKQTGKKRKVSMSPKDSLAKVEATTKKTMTNKKTNKALTKSQEDMVIDSIDSPEPSRAVAKVEEKIMATIQNESRKNSGDVAAAANEKIIVAPLSASKVQNVEVAEDAPMPAAMETKKPAAKANSDDYTNIKPAGASVTKAAASSAEASKQPAPKKKTPAQKSSSAATKENKHVSGTSTKAIKETSAKKTAASNETKKAANTHVTDSEPAKSPAKNGVKPKPKKKKQRFEDQLLHKMFISCRPWTVKELAKEMDNSGEAAVNFCLLSHIDKGWVIKKEFATKSRTKELYWANQECKDRNLWEKHLTNFVDMKQIQESRLELAQLQQQQKRVDQELAVVLQTPSNEEVDLQCQAAEAEVLGLQQQLQAMKLRINAAKENDGAQSKALFHRSSFGMQQHAPPKKKSTPAALRKKINTMRDEWRKRKTRCMDFVEQLADGMEKKVKDVIKMMEIETDEEAGVKMPPKYPA